jgi:hypothetical protein
LPAVDTNQKLRHQLQKTGQYRAVKKLVRSEIRWMSEVNHTVSKRIAQFADSLLSDLVLEDLSGCRQTMKQSKNVRSGRSIQMFILFLQNKFRGL